MKFKKSDPVSGPSSAIGIMRFFETTAESPKLSPWFVVAVSFLIAVVFMALHVIS